MKVRDTSTLLVETSKDLDGAEAPPLETHPTVVEADSSKEPLKAGSKY